jgi:hypothetical protein
VKERHMKRKDYIRGKDSIEEERKTREEKGNSREASKEDNE